MEIEVDPMNITFAKVMEIFTIIGLIAMIIPAIGYFAGVSQFVDLQDAVKHWDKPAGKFWEETKQIEISGYAWFLDNLNYMDCLSILGIVVLALAPLLSLIATIPKSKGVYVLLLTILVVEFIIAILRPLFMQVTGH
jgi:hypothetical protein